MIPKGRNGQDRHWSKKRGMTMIHAECGICLQESIEFFISCPVGHSCCHRCWKHRFLQCPFCRSPTLPLDVCDRTRNLLAKQEIETMFYPSLCIGQEVDASDSDHQWYHARILKIRDTMVRVHFYGWSSRWDAWVKKSMTRLLPHGCKTDDRWFASLAVRDTIEFCVLHPMTKRPMWHLGTIICISKDRTSLCILPHTEQQGRRVRIRYHPDSITPPGTHVRTTTT